LPIVALDLASQVAEHQRAGCDDEEAEEAEPVGETAAEDRPGDEVKQGQDDDLLVVRSATPRGEANDLEQSGELDGDVERRAPGEQPSALHQKEQEREDERRQRLSSTALAVADQKVQSAHSPIVIGGVLRLLDFVLISFSGLALHFGYATAAVGDSWRYPILAFSMAAATVAILQALDIYQIQHFQASFSRIPRLLLCWCVVFIIALSLSHVARLDDASLRIWFAAFFGVGIVALISERFAVRAVLGKWAKEGRLDRRTIIVGADENGERLITALRAQEGSNLDILGVFDDRNDDRVQGICAGIPKLGKVDDILEFAQRARVDLAQQRRGLAHRDRARPERLDGEPVAGELA